MNKLKVKLIKECEICKSKATCLCFQCISYFCEAWFKYVHDKEVNSTHKKEIIDPFVPIDVKCPEHDKYPLDFFCVDEKGKSNLFFHIILF